MPISIRTIESRDVDVVVEIENRSFPAPFSRDLFTSMISRMPPFGGFVVEKTKHVIGYLFYLFIKDEMEILTIAVDRPFQRAGIARELMETTLKIAKGQGVKSVFLEVRPSNTSARNLYDSLGFQKTGLRKGYYKDNGEDAIVMAKSL